MKVLRVATKQRALPSLLLISANNQHGRPSKQHHMSIFPLTYLPI